MSQRTQCGGVHFTVYSNALILKGLKRSFSLYLQDVHALPRMLLYKGFLCFTYDSASLMYISLTVIRFIKGENDFINGENPMTFCKALYEHLSKKQRDVHDIPCTA